MDDSADATVVGDPSSGVRSAETLRRDPARVDDARRMVPREIGPDGLQRLAEFAARLLGAPSSQISLLTDDQLVAAGFGLPPGRSGR